MISPNLFLHLYYIIPENITTRFFGKIQFYYQGKRIFNATSWGNYKAIFIPLFLLLCFVSWGASRLAGTVIFPSIM